MLLIVNGYVYDPASGREGYLDILEKDGRILKIGENLYEKDALSKNEKELHVVNAAGLCVAPGLVDVHVHFRDPGFTYKEDIITGARAAAKGGFTTVVLMANTKPVVDNVETLAYVLDKGKETGIHVESCAAVTVGLQGKELTNMSELKAAGAAGFTDDGIPILDGRLAERAMEEVAKTGLPVSFHEENPAFIENNGINRGRASAHFGVGGSDRQAEISMIQRDLEIADRTGACVNIQHISTGEGVELVRKAKRKGVPVHAEATPHHFTLTEDALIQYGTLAKMNPPLREESDRKAIIEGLMDGTIDLIATDHAPHSREEKERPITEAPSGIIGLETALALGITELVEPGYLTMMEFIKKMTCNPAGMYHLDAGYLKEGGPADLVLFAPGERITVKKFASKSQNSPFAGWQLNGRIHTTICNGRIVYDKTEDEG